MSSLRNAIPRKAHKERSQPQSRKKFGHLEKHKDYVVRAKAFHQKEEALQKLKEKAAFRNPDEFYFKMIKTSTVGGVHRLESEANKYTHDELILMKTQDIGYILQKLQSEKNVNDNLLIMYMMIGRGQSIQCVRASEDIPDHIKRKTAASYREVEARKSRIQELEKLYMDMARQKELQKKGRKRKLREDEIICPTSKPLYKWRAERKR
ncbi:hypothetical protein LWI28_012732 [Acer negundo]|uniref:U3 small nucleolar RNA-associated protein 11 n=1 Tax=Acer negundo TaxID=4023 RepID=A0AAD5NWM6_ACENE|nr:hypothetical protein LWI28_012732 [Acer negundo]